jgi:hypothetical protein
LLSVPEDWDFTYQSSWWERWVSQCVRGAEIITKLRRGADRMIAMNLPWEKWTG